MYFLNKNINIITYFIKINGRKSTNDRTCISFLFFILCSIYTHTVSQDHVAFRVANTLPIVISFFDH